MGIFELIVDGRKEYVRSTHARLRAAMYAHIRAERAKGRKLSEITFVWGPIHISRTI